MLILARLPLAAPADCRRDGPTPGADAHPAPPAATRTVFAGLLSRLVPPPERPAAPPAPADETPPDPAASAAAAAGLTPAVLAGMGLPAPAAAAVRATPAGLAFAERARRIVAELQNEAILEQKPQMLGRNLSAVVRSK